MAVCPVSRVSPLFAGPKQAGPGAERFRRTEDPSVDNWIDLCIGCHLCDLVCSSSVPISELNLIAKAKYLDEKGRSLRDWLLTHSFLYGRFGAFFSPLINRLFRNSIFKWIAESVLRIDRRRELPPYQSPTFRQWFKKHQSQGPQTIEADNPPSPPLVKSGRLETEGGEGDLNLIPKIERRLPIFMDVTSIRTKWM